MTRSSSEDKKPEGYDDIPKEIIYPDVTKHEDWDEEEYGEWTAPTIPNVDYKGPWTQKKIKNPNYKGKWKAPLIDNPGNLSLPTVVHSDLFTVHLSFLIRSYVF